MIREHIVDAFNDAAGDLEPDEDMGPVEVLRAIVAGLGRAHVTEVSVDDLTWIADDMSGPPWPD